MNRFARSSHFVTILLAGTLAVAASMTATKAEDHASLRIAYPRPDDVVREDTIPIWLRADDASALATMKLALNGVDLTEQFSPYGIRRKTGFHALANVSPRPGGNRIELGTGKRTRTVEFRFEPYPMRVRVQVLEDGKAVPARVSFHGLEGTPDPSLAPPIWERIAGGPHKAEQIRNFVYTRDGKVDLHLPEGKYEVLASRGPAYSLARGVAGPEAAPIELTIERIVDTAGWISADFHVHAMPSRDSMMPLPDRVLSYLAQDVDVIVASDHNTITDYRVDLPDSFPWPERFEAIPGTEADLPRKHRELLGAGHWNAWPLEREKGGSFATDVRPRGLATISELYQAIRGYNGKGHEKRYGDLPVVLQMNHPRGMQFEPGAATGRTHGHLVRAHYDPEKPLSAEDNGKLLARSAPDLPRPVDIDAIELLNRLAFGLYLESRRDWFAWIAQGFVPTGTANTDSHAYVITEAGFPRNWVRYEKDLPVDAASLAQAVRSRQIVGSTGPLIEIEPWSADGNPVDEVPEQLAITVRSAPWIPVEEVRVWVGGELVQTRPISSEITDPFARRQVEHRFVVPLSIDHDTFVVVEAGDTEGRMLQTRPHEGPLGRIAPAVRVLAFTNPLLIDTDADGTWRPPGSD